MIIRESVNGDELTKGGQRRKRGRELPIKRHENCIAADILIY